MSVPGLAQFDRHVLVGGGLKVDVGQVEGDEFGEQHAVHGGDVAILGTPDACAGREAETCAVAAHRLTSAAS